VFYSVTENAPFAVNHAIRTFLDRVCKTVPVFAGNSGNGYPEGQSGLVAGPERGMDEKRIAG